MHFRKVYGQSKIDRCVFCGKQAVTKNEQEIPVCISHKSSVLNEFKCACGNTLDLMTGKYGPFFKCDRCGIVNMRKALEMNDVRDATEAREVKQEPREQKEEIVMPGDPRYFD